MPGEVVAALGRSCSGPVSSAAIPADGWLPPWFGADPEGLAQGTAYLPFGSPGTPRRLGQGSDLSRLVALLGLREYLPTPVIGKLA